ncbi:hypothetical protein CB0940_01026 [Cercospora beticola]|uniref:Uncharacterized protein n=1 Tax=Cercospora beticola TaxID=122368 RepID=A0A2G5I7L4_CERBT|nr:hypothetical protein CB0940_01026 [Cercospora beticola]PIB00798.1 hypothetical protein CB0940_01026 [Cercospora beticola]WPA96450.1 hypothetical protein RHO25_001057 [Cercospora beticola]
MVLRRSLRIHRTKILATFLLLPLFYFLLHRLAPALQHPSRIIDHATFEHASTTGTNRSVALVIATRAADDISWAYRLQIPQLQVIRYISDSASAKYRPAVPKGHEALMYLTYIHDFYDDLPEIVIFIHADENPWHMDGALLESVSFALNHLDLEEVLLRQYFNLRVMWKHGCPAQIYTAETRFDEKKQEQHLMDSAFRSIFGPDVEVPEILAGPCCSQFAVTREAVRRRGRHEYKHYVDWLIETDWSDYIAGRVWEHIWPVVFLNTSVDCTVESQSLCRMYGICFERQRELERYQQVWDARRFVDNNITFWNELWKPRDVASLRHRQQEYTKWLHERLGAALKRGEDGTLRKVAVGNLYT